MGELYQKRSALIKHETLASSLNDPDHRLEIRYHPGVLALLPTNPFPHKPPRRQQGRLSPFTDL